MYPAPLSPNPPPSGAEEKALKDLECPLLFPMSDTRQTTMYQSLLLFWFKSRYSRRSYRVVLWSVYVIQFLVEHLLLAFPYLEP